MEQITKRDEDENNDQNMTMNMEGEGRDDDYGLFYNQGTFQKLHSSPVLTVKAYFDFKVLLPKHWSG